MKLTFITTNKNKVREANEIAEAYGIELEQYDFDYPEIRSESIEEVAREGAEVCFKEVGKPLIVEDSGFFIETLGGFPGTYSAFVHNKIGNGGLLRIMDGKTNRMAEMRACVAYHDGESVKTFAGAVKGVLAEKERGAGGFGYDPIFIPEGHEKTFAEDSETKSKISHRKRAFVKLFENLK